MFAFSNKFCYEDCLVTLMLDYDSLLGSNRPVYNELAISGFCTNEKIYACYLSITFCLRELLFLLDLERDVSLLCSSSVFYTFNGDNRVSPKSCDSFF